MDMKTIAGQVFRRAFTLLEGGVNIEQRTATLSFSSDTPVERFWGFEILDHRSEAVNLQRLRQAGNLIMDHNPADVVGVVEAAQVDLDGKARAQIRFGRSTRAQEVFQDVADGIRKTVSVGYSIEALRQTDPIDGKEAFLATRWTPYEISLTAVPADASVGVGRSSQEKIIMDKQDQISVRTIRQGDRPESDHRIEEIAAIGKSLSPHAPGVQELADRAILEGLDVETFRQMAISRISSKPPIETSPAHLDLSRGDARQYSILRAIKAQLSGDWRDAGLELECSRTIAERQNKAPKGFLIPLDIPFGGQRTLTAGTATTGGEMVGTDHLGANFLDALRQELYIFEFGAQILPGLVGNVEIPSMGDATFYHVGEDVDVTDSTPATAEVTLSPKTLGGSVPMSRRFLKQSTPAAEGLVRNLLVRGAAVEMEAKILDGSGAAAQPLGLLNQTGLGTVTIAAAGNPTWAELIEFETDVLTAKALRGGLAYFITPAIQGYLKATVKVTGDAGAGFLMQDNQINGYPARATTNMPTNGILFGNFRETLIGLWGGMDVKPDESTKAAAGGLVVRVFLDYDVGVGHAAAFSKNV